MKAGISLGWPQNTTKYLSGYRSQNNIWTTDRHWHPNKKQGMLTIWQRRSVCHLGAFIPLLQFRCPLSPISMSRWQAQTYVTLNSKIAALGNHKNNIVYFGGGFNKIVTSIMKWFPLLCIHRLPFSLLILLMLLPNLIFYFPPPLLPLVRKLTAPHLSSRLILSTDLYLNSRVL